MNQIHKRLHISEQDFRALTQMLATGALASTKAVQAHLSQKVFGFKRPDVVPLKTTRKYMRSAGFPPKLKTSISLAEDRIRELKKCPPELQHLAKPILDVAEGVSIRESALKAKLDESSLRYRIHRVRKNGLQGLSLPRGKCMEAFFVWCDQEKRPTVKAALVKFGSAGKKSARTFARYIMDWKDQRRIPRRHWSNGGSKHSGMSGYGS